ncbi:MAG: hypothetical protein FWE36_00170 [Erysipelotrichales bacterium]|nr:hypothetical protein [Erysipelotrichales bacterium]
MNKVSFGLTNVYYAKLSDEDSRIEYDLPLRLHGAQELSHEVIGGSERVFADDRVFAVLSQNAGRSVTLKLTELDNDFKIKILGYRELSNGNIIEVANAKTEKFALGFELQGDKLARRTWFYKCSIVPINEATKTKGESAEANAITLDIVAEPIEVGSEMITFITAHKNDQNYEEFLTRRPQTLEPGDS